MRLIDFMREFPDEQSCERKHCHYRQSLKANTAMHGSQLPLSYWFIVFTSRKPRILQFLGGIDAAFCCYSSILFVYL